jgi:hypothetical protein
VCKIGGGSIIREQLSKVAYKDASVRVPAFEELAGHGDQIPDLLRQDLDAALHIEYLHVLFGDYVVVGSVSADPSIG